MSNDNNKHPYATIVILAILFLSGLCGLVQMLLALYLPGSGINISNILRSLLMISYIMAGIIAMRNMKTASIIALVSISLSILYQGWIWATTGLFPLTEISLTQKSASEIGAIYILMAIANLLIKLLIFIYLAKEVNAKDDIIPKYIGNIINRFDLSNYAVPVLLVFWSGFSLLGLFFTSLFDAGGMLGVVIISHIVMLVIGVLLMSGRKTPTYILVLGVVFVGTYTLSLVMGDIIPASQIAISLQPRDYARSIVAIGTYIDSVARILLSLFILTYIYFSTRPVDFNRSINADMARLFPISKP